MFARTPLRIGFFGGGSDLPSYFAEERGTTLSMSIKRYAYARMRTLHEPFKSSVYSANGTGFSRAGDDYYLRAMKSLFSREYELLLSCDVERGSGLGASSALIASITALSPSFARFTDLDLAKRIAHTTAVIELEVLGMPIGYQDQYACAIGGLNLITYERDVHGNPKIQVDPVRPYSIFFDHLVNCLTLVRVSTRTGTAGKILKGTTARLNEHDAKTRSLIKWGADAAPVATHCLMRGDLEGFGEMLHEAWMRKRALGTSDFGIDHAYDTARAAGAIGGKLCGAGKGGYMVLLTPYNRLESVHRALFHAGMDAEPVAYEPSGTVVLEPPTES